MFQNTLVHPMKIKKGQVLGRASMATPYSYMVDSGQHIDWADLAQPGPRPRQCPGTRPPTYMAADFYTCPWGPAGSISLDEQLSFLAHYVFTSGVERDMTPPSEQLSFSTEGREEPRPRSITEDELWRKLVGAQRRQAGDLPSAEEYENLPAEAPIPTKLPTEMTGENPEGICAEDIKFGGNLSPSQVKELTALILEHSKAFTKGNRLGNVHTGVKVTIDTGGRLLPPQPQRPMGPGKRTVVDEIINQLLGWDVIEPSVSPTASPIVLVWQNNKWRFCVDFRALNAVTVGDAYPMIRSDYIFVTLAGKRFFSLLDAMKGYHQMSIAEEDRHKTAFVTHRGLYQYKRLPFGLKNAPAQFQHMMDEIISGLRWQAALVYIDDLLVYSGSWTEHLQHLRTILVSAIRAGLVFNLDKCRFGHSDIQLLGHSLSRYGLHTLAAKTEAIRDLDRPRTLKELHRIMGMFGYYRMFITQFAAMAAPLNALKTQGGPPGDKK